MPDYDVQYFQNLLEDSRSECLKYQLPRKEEILDILKGHEEVVQIRDSESKIKDDLKRQWKRGEATKEEVDAAEKAFKELQKETQEALDTPMNALIPIIEKDVRLDQEPKSLQIHLMKCSIITQQGPKEMAAFCQEHGHEFVNELLGNEDMMKEMLFNGGAKMGKFLEAYKLFGELMHIFEEDESLYSDCHARLAMGTALELAVPLYMFKSTSDTIDPKQRFLHYIHAHKNGELDPSFPYFTTWEYRHIVNCDSTDEELQWGRDQFKRFCPDALRVNDPKFLYTKLVRTDVSYQKPDWGENDERTYRKLLSGGGKCGPRAWMGRFLCKAFGVPSWGVRQPGHAALARWTPQKGWVTCFGAAMVWSWWEDRDGEDFKFEAHSRHYVKDPDVYFGRVTLLQCMAHACQEKSISRDHAVLGPSSLWSSLTRMQLRYWCEKAECMAKEGIFARGPKDGEKLEDCDIRRYLSRKEEPQNDKQIEVDGKRVRIPACGHTNKSKSMSVVRCFEGGGQVHFPKDYSGSVEYKLPPSVPRRQYDLTFKICTVHAEQESELLCVVVNEGPEFEVPVLYTVGDWAYTNAVKIELGSGDNLTITRKSGSGRFWAIAMKELILNAAD